MPEGLLVCSILFPGDIAFMMIGDKDGPLLGLVAWLSNLPLAAFHQDRPSVRPAKGIGPRIDRMMQDTEDQGGGRRDQLNEGPAVVPGFTGDHHAFLAAP